MKQAVAGLALSIMFCAARAFATDAPQAKLSVTLPACAAPLFDGPSFLALLKVELAEDGVGDVTLRSSADPFQVSSQADVASLAIEQENCSTNASALVLHLVDPLTQKSSARGLNVANTPAAARSRLLALASAELLRASWAELATMRRRAVIGSVTRLGAQIFQIDVQAAPAPAASSNAPASKPVAAEATFERRWQLGASMGLRNFLNARSGHSFGALTAALDTAHARLSMRAAGAWGQLGDEVGDVHTGAALLGLGYSGRWMMAHRAQLTLGPRIDAGYAWASGSPASASVRAHQGGEAVLLLAAEAGCSAALSDSLRLNMSLEAGHSVAGLAVQSLGRNMAGLYGPYAGISFGAELNL